MGAQSSQRIVVHFDTAHPCLYIVDVSYDDAGNMASRRTPDYGFESSTRRRWLRTLVAGAAMIALDAAGATKRRDGFTVLTFGDSILDCARYNEYGVHPGQLILRNDDHLFPDFRGNDLLSFAFAQLDHRAWDGSRVEDLPRQALGLRLPGRGWRW